jgi:hypothetical protein
MLGKTELLPGTTQRIEARLMYDEGVLAGQLVSGRVTGPDSIGHAIVLVDDGTGGDETAADGTYSVLFGNNSVSGQYQIDLEATGTYGNGLILNRRAGGTYFVDTRPDAIVRGEDIQLSHEWDDSVLVVGVTLTVRNLGQASADTARVQFLDQESGLVFSETTLVSLGVGQDAVVTANWNARYDLPEYHLGGRVTVLGSTLESEILNNEAYTPFEVAGVPDVSEPPNDANSATLRLALESFPNPFRSETRLRFAIPQRQWVDLTIFDAAGRQVRELVSGELEAGTHVSVWDGLDASGRRVSTGVYFSRLRIETGNSSNRLIIIH